MPLFRPPDIAKLKEKGDIRGLIKVLEYNKDPEARKDAAWILGELGKASDPQAEKSLTTCLLKDKDPYVRCSAAEALRKVSGRQAVETLCGVLKNDSSEWVRAKAAEDLGEIGDRSSVTFLVRALIEDSQWDVQNRAAQALGKIGDTRAVEPLILAMNRTCEPSSFGFIFNQIVRISAAEALGKLGDPRAIEPLEAILVDESERRDMLMAAGEVLESLRKMYGETTPAIIGIEEAAAELSAILQAEKAYDQPRESSILLAQEIGEGLNREGGFERMQQVMQQVMQQMPFEYQRLSFWWDGIGEWRY